MLSRTDALLSVVYDDEQLLVVDKPAGLVVHPSKTGPESSLIGRVRLHLESGEGRLVNRLDRETSGLVVVAKSADVARELGRLFADGHVVKEYRAIVHGSVTGAGLTITAPLGRDERSPVAIKDCVRPDGAPAATRVDLVRTFARGGLEFSLVRVVPATGRKHQIRIHLAHVGHPIVGDKLYGGDEACYLRFVVGVLTDDDRERLLLEYHALHAGRLAFDWNGRQWEFEAPLRPELTAFTGPP